MTKDTGKGKLWFEIMFWRILKHSPVFRYWFKRHMTRLMYDLENFDLESDKIKEKYQKLFAKANR